MGMHARGCRIEVKELKLRPATDVHDYQVKVSWLNACARHNNGWLGAS
jgi:translation initiation factor IF-3